MEGPWQGVGGDGEVFKSSEWLLVRGGRQWEEEEEEGELLVGLGGRSWPYEFEISLERQRDNSGGMSGIQNYLNPTKVGLVDHPISKILNFDFMAAFHVLF